MKSSLRWNRKAILALGNILAFDADQDGSGDQNSTAGGAEQDNDSDKSTDSGADDDKDGDDPATLKKKLQNRREQAERQDAEIKRLKAIETKADELQQKVDEAERKNKTELENAQSDLEKATKQLEAKDDTIRRLTVENAFMSLDGIKWHDPATALKLVDLSEVEFDEKDGAVKNKTELIKAAKALAKDKPYLVRSATDVDDKETPPGKTSGKPPVKQSGKAKTEEEIRKKYNIHS